MPNEVYEERESERKAAITFISLFLDFNRKSLLLPFRLLWLCSSRTCFTCSVLMLGFFWMRRDFVRRLFVAIAVIVFAISNYRQFSFVGVHTLKLVKMNYIFDLWKHLTRVMVISEAISQGPSPKMIRAKLLVFKNFKDFPKITLTNVHLGICIMIMMMGWGPEAG